MSQLEAREVERFASLAAAEAGRTAADSRLSRVLIDGMREAGFARHFVPRHWGGGQGRFATCAEAVAAVGAADASVAWCASIAASMGRMAAYLPEAGQKKVWEDGPDAVVCGTLQSAGTARRVPGGWVLSGSWPFVTGAHFADWALLTCLVPAADRSELRALLVPRAGFTVRETWLGPGLRATRTDTLVIAEALVPEEHTFDRGDLMEGLPRQSAGTPYTVPHDAVSGLTFAAPLLGAARGALTEWSTDARTRARAAGTVATGTAQVLTTASGLIDAAGLLLELAAHKADVGQLDRRAALEIRRLYPVAADLLITAVNMLFRTAGSSVIAGGGPLERHWRDANSGSVHPALLLEQSAVEYGAAAFGVATAPGR